MSDKIEQIKQQLEAVWRTAVQQQTIHIRPRINEAVAELDRETVEQLGPFLRTLYRRSDRRVELWIAFIAVLPKDGLFALKVSTVELITDEGYADGDIVKQRQLRQLAESCEEFESSIANARKLSRPSI